MNSASKTIGFGLLSGLLAGGIAFLVLSDLPINNTAQSSETPKLKVEQNPLSRETKVITSFAPVVQSVARSVVSVYTTKMVKENSSSLFRDPMLRRFFGFDDEDNGGAPAQPHREQNLGSGVIVSSDGYILTNNHVVEGADEIKVSLSDGTELNAKVVGTDPPTDVAVLKVQGKDLPAVTMTDSSNIQVGDIVLAIGNPFDVGQTVTMGIVSATRRSGFGIVDYEDFIQTDASINPGNSGGALVDAAGRLVGINTAILSRTGGNQGIGFAVPVNMARAIMDQIIKTGKVVRGYLGVMIQPVTPAMARVLELPEAKGALVGDVTPNSPAAKAGIKPEDVIVELDGKKVTDSRELRLKISQTPPKTKAHLKVLRRGQVKEFTIALGELPTEQLAKGRRGEREQSQEKESLAGVDLTDLDSRARRQLNIPARIEGALVASVDPNSTAAAGGLQGGDVITEVNHQPVHNAEEASQSLQDTKQKAILLRVWSRGASHYLVIENSGK